MSRRVSKSISTFFALILILSAPSAFAGRHTPTFDDPAGSIGPRIVRMVKMVKKVVKGYLQGTSNTETPPPPASWPGPPIG